ncbi:MAG: hypothetical protein CVU64_24175 [Deltaproteobacteria bacterium HGW-Deltaproteobacteria-21]|nr:MAG: hypothetical protein CVU64_24175 [Deltaproteobacteria bacterium HGW-Deltaproteobacteria-21]
MRMTIVPEERLIAIDGDFLRFDYEVPAGVHAIQVYDDHAEIEYKDGQPNKIMKGEELQDLIAQYLPLHAAERDRVNSTIPPTPYSIWDADAGAWVVDLARATAHRQTELKTALRQYIYSHYDAGTQATMQALYVRDDTPVVVKDKLSAVWSWISMVLTFYYQTKEAIGNLPDAEAIISHAWDFAQFDALRPDVTLQGIYSGLGLSQP